MSLTRRQALLSAGTLAAASAVPELAQAQKQDPKAAGTSAATTLPGGPACLTDFEPLARDRISHSAWEYITGGAGDELTTRWNREAYDHLRLKPRVLVDVSKIDTRLQLFGQQMDFPVLLAPTAYHKLVHSEGEVATARGAAAAGATLVVSSFATVAIEEVSAAAKKPLWFQLYVQPDRGFTRELV